MTLRKIFSSDEATFKAAQAALLALTLLVAYCTFLPQYTKTSFRLIAVLYGAILATSVLRWWRRPFVRVLVRVGWLLPISTVLGVMLTGFLLERFTDAGIDPAASPAQLTFEYVAHTLYIVLVMLLVIQPSVSIACRKTARFDTGVNRVLGFLLLCAAVATAFILPDNRQQRMFSFLSIDDIYIRIAYTFFAAGSFAIGMLTEPRPFAALLRKLRKKTTASKKRL